MRSTTTILLLITVPLCSRRRKEGMARALDCIRVIFLWSKVCQSCNNISYDWPHIRLVLNTHCSNGKSLVQAPRRILTLEQGISHFWKFLTIFKQGSCLSLNQGKISLIIDIRIFHNQIKTVYHVSVAINLLRRTTGCIISTLYILALQGGE